MLWQNIPINDGEISLLNHFFSENESVEIFNELLQNIEWEQPQVSVFGKLYAVPRKTAFYGLTPLTYRYSGLTHQAKPYTKALQIVHQKLVETCPNFKFNSVLLNYYRNGHDKMGWHADDELELGKNPAIASVNFGASRLFQLKHKHNSNLKTQINLTNGSLLLMHGSTQHHWKHQIPKQMRVAEPRINLTFRKIIS